MRGVGLLLVLGFLLLLIILSQGRRLAAATSPPPADLRQVSDGGSPGGVTPGDFFLPSETHFRGRPLYHDLSQEGRKELSSNFLRRNAIVSDPPLGGQIPASYNTGGVPTSPLALRTTASSSGRTQVLTPSFLTKTGQREEPWGERHHRFQFPGGYNRSQLIAGYHRSQLPAGYHRSQLPERHRRPTHSPTFRITSNNIVTHQPVGGHKLLPRPPDARRGRVPLSWRTSTSQRTPAGPGLDTRPYIDLIAEREWVSPWAVQVVGGSLVAAAFLSLAILTSSAPLPWSTHSRGTQHTHDATEHMVEEAVRLWAAVEGREDCCARALCRMGGFLGNLTGGSLLLVAAQRFVPREWEAMVYLMAEGAIFGSDCRGWRCGRERPDDTKTS